MTAEEAHHWGLVNEVVPADQLMETAKRWAQEICEAAPLSVRATKQAALLCLDMSLEEAYNTRFPAQEAMQGSEDSREGPRAFAERRKPVWQGR
jgi:enoyl-CoA hydratase/carnithine racemase